MKGKYVSSYVEMGKDFLSSKEVEKSEGKVDWLNIKIKHF